MSSTESDVGRRLFASLASMDQEALISCFEPDVRAHFHPSLPPELGHHALRTAFQTLSAAFDEVSPEEIARVEAGRTIAIEWKAATRPAWPDGIGGLLVLRLSKSGRVKEFWNHLVSTQQAAAGG